ncbi:MAG: tetratricopeptide repeat protein, partial [Flammeovirgaceae bacterium]
AKKNIDLCIEDPKLSLKANTWYFRWLIYTSIDTVKDQQLHNLDADAFDKAIQALNKAEELNKGSKNEFSIGIYPDVITLKQIKQNLSNFYINQANDKFNKKEYADASKGFEKILNFLPNDSAVVKYVGYSSYFAKETEKAIKYCKLYADLGGPDSNPYLILLELYNVKNKDFETVHTLSKEYMKKFPKVGDFSAYALNSLLEMKKYAEAKKWIEEGLAKKPDDVQSIMMLGKLNLELKDYEGAEKAFRDIIKIESDNYDAYASLASMKYDKVKKTRNQRNEISGTKDADLKKRADLFQQIKAELLEAVPYYEKCEAIKPADADVLYGLLAVYGDLAQYDESYEAKEKKLKAKMRGLKLEVD